MPPLPDFAERYGDQRWPAFEIAGSVGRLTRDGAVVRAVPSSSWNVEARACDMEKVGVDMQVISPLPPVICDWADPEKGTEWCVRVNEGIAGVAAARPRRFVGLGTVPIQHPDRAVRVLERASRDGLAGIEIGTTAGERELDHPDLREFFAAAAALGMVIFVHPLLLGAEVAWTDRIACQEVAFGLGMTSDTAIAATKLLFGGVFEEQPDLRILLSHGGGTFPWALPRIQKGLDLRGDSRVTPHLRHLYVDSVVYQAPNVRYLIETLGAGQVLFGTDYPLPAQDDGEGAILEEIPASDRSLVEGENASRLFDGG